MTLETLVPDGLNRVTRSLRTLVSTLEGRGGGTVYVPPGNWIFDDSLEPDPGASVLVIPATVTIWFAPVRFC